MALLRSQAPLRRVVAAIAGRLFATRAWERLGYARAADYAAERAGLSARQLQELAYVDAALTALPQIDAALYSGQLPWTKGRLLCRVVTPEDEKLWLEAASGLSAQALAREVRAVDGRALENGGAEPPANADDPETRCRETVQLRCSAGVKGKWFHARQLARRVAGENLSPWMCAEYMAAEVLGALGLEVEIEGEEEGLAEARAEPAVSARSPEAPALGHPGGEAPGGVSCGESVAGCAAASPHGADATPSSASPPSVAAFLAPLVADLACADAFELDARLRRALRLEQRQLARLGPLLLHVASERLFRDLGYRGLDAHARERLGMAPSKARALLRLERIAQLVPAFGEAWRAGRLSWTQAEALAPLLVLDPARPWQAGWLARARGVSVRRLRDDVDWAIASDAFDPAALPQLPVGLQTGARPTVSGARDRLFFTAPRDVARLFRAVLATLQRHLERASGRPSSQDEAFDAMLDHALESWGSHRPLPKKLSRKYRVFARDGWRCTVPGCTGYRNLHDHHIVFRSAGGSDDLTNRTTLCVCHHLRAIHAGLARCMGQAPGRLRFALGLRQGRPPLVSYASGDFVLGGSASGAPGTLGELAMAG
ncbi:MAG: HNH endonuclease [Deltaproteobacteria bacterium]|nr:HNH endonuclease [Deltaproteobacteria bacterium]